MNVDDICQRASWLRQYHADRVFERTRIRNLCDGGTAAVTTLLGKDGEKMVDLPAANLVLSGLTRLGQKLGRLPEARCEVPSTNDSERARKAAHKRERIIAAYDEASNLELAMPQQGRWLPGYAFTPWVIRERVNSDGYRYPHAELRDPYDAYPGPWGAQQQPEDVAFYRVVAIDDLVRQYPQHEHRLRGDRKRGPGGAVYLNPPVTADNLAGPGFAGGGGWENPARVGLHVVEYYNANGMWVVVPDRNLILEYLPNMLDSGPQFVIAKRPSFNKPAGQYDQIIGLLAQMARLNLLAQMGMEDATFAETNIFGEPPAGSYRRGRFAVNVMPHGTTVQRMQHNLPYQYFEQINRVERQLRAVAGYPITDDAQSPMSFVTGAGLEELGASISAEVKEYQTVIRYALQALDAKRLEWDEKAYGKRRKPLVGVSKGEAFAEHYTPETHINGNYRTRRVFGMMSGWDEPQKIVGGLQLVQGEIVSRQTMRENVDGIENVVREEERIRDEQAFNAVYQNLLGMANQGDPRAVMAAIELLPNSELKETLSKFFTPNGPEMSEGELAMAGMLDEGPVGPSGPPPDVATVLSQLSGSGGAVGSVRTIGRLGSAT